LGTSRWGRERERVVSEEWERERVGERVGERESGREREWERERVGERAPKKIRSGRPRIEPCRDEKLIALGGHTLTLTDPCRTKRKRKTKKLSNQ
jgi:hypothetical protein